MKFAAVLMASAMISLAEAFAPSIGSVLPGPRRAFEAPSAHSHLGHRACRQQPLSLLVLTNGVGGRAITDFTVDKQNLSAGEKGTVILRVKQALVKAALSFLVLLGALGLMRPSSAAAMSSSVVGQHQELTRSSSDAATSGSVTLHRGHRIGFVAPVQDAMVAATKWKGLLRHGLVTEKVSGISSEIGAWLKFQSYELLACSGLIKVMMYTAFSAVLVAIGAWMLRAARGDESGESLGETLFTSYALLMNVAGASAVDEESGKMALVVNTIFVAGIFTFAILLGVVTSSIENSLSEALAGTHKVWARQHVVLVNSKP